LKSLLKEHLIGTPLAASLSENFWIHALGRTRHGSDQPSGRQKDGAVPKSSRPGCGISPRPPLQVYVISTRLHEQATASSPRPRDRTRFSARVDARSFARAATGPGRTLTASASCALPGNAHRPPPATGQPRYPPAGPELSRSDVWAWAVRRSALDLRTISLFVSTWLTY